MASTIKIKRSAVSGNAPNTSNITTGELALNTADGILYSSDGSSIFEIGANLSSLSVANITYPTSDGTSGQVLTTNGSGTLSFTNASGGGGGLTQEQEDILEILQDDSSYFYTAIGDLYTKAEPSGSDTYIQYNNAGIFGSDSTFTFNDATKTLSVPNISVSGVGGNITAASATITGDATFSANVTFDTVTISSIQTSSDSFVDSDNELMTAAAIDDRIAIVAGVDALKLLQDDSSYFYTAIGDLYTKAEPSGSDSFVQYNNAGIFGSDSTFTFNDATNTLSVPNIVISSQSTLTDLSVSGNTDLDIVTANTIATDGNVTIGGTLNTYSIDAIYDRGILNSADSAYFYTKIEEIEENLPFSEISVFTSSNTSSQEIYSFDGDIYGTGKFIITAKNTVTNDRYALEMLVVHNGTTSYDTVYAESGNTSLSTYSTSITGSSVSIDVIPGSSDIIKHRIIGQLIVGD